MAIRIRVLLCADRVISILVDTMAAVEDQGCGNLIHRKRYSKTGKSEPAKQLYRLFIMSPSPLPHC
jgi:hypothetical protein